MMSFYVFHCVLTVLTCKRHEHRWQACPLAASCLKVTYFGITIPFKYFNTGKQETILKVKWKFLQSHNFNQWFESESGIYSLDNRLPTHPN